MPYIKEHNVIFIHIPKTGGTSVEKAFGIYHDWDYEKLLYNKEEKINGITTAPQHWTPNLIENKLGKDTYSNAIKFTIIRNPYSRVLSEYFYKTGSTNLYNFDEWFFDYYSNIDNDHKIPQHLFLQTHIDFIARTESLQDDFTRFVDQYNIKINPNLPYINKSRYNNKLLINYLSKDVISKINYIYKEDFDLLNYKTL